jgi:hypothetical protein
MVDTYKATQHAPTGWARSRDDFEKKIATVKKLGPAETTTTPPAMASSPYLEYLV